MRAARTFLQEHSLRGKRPPDGLPPAISGGADNALRDDIRARLADGSLCRVDGRAWAGKGTGAHTCVCCHEAITRLDVQYEPQAWAGLRAHASCFTVWLAESVALKGLERRSETAES